MKITFKLFAQLQDYLPIEAKRTNAFTLELEDDSSIADVISRFNLPPRLVHLVLLDGVHVLPAERQGRVLKDGNTLAIWPPVAGG